MKLYETGFYTPDVLNKPRELIYEVERWCVRVGVCIDDHQLSLGKVDGRSKDVTRYWPT